MASFAALNASFAPFGGTWSLQAAEEKEVIDEDALMTAPIDELLGNNNHHPPPHPPPDNLVGEEEEEHNNNNTTTTLLTTTTALLPCEYNSAEKKRALLQVYEGKYQ